MNESYDYIPIVQNKEWSLVGIVPNTNNLKKKFNVKEYRNIKLYDELNIVSNEVKFKNNSYIKNITTII
ncbi:MAG: hypothetical protein QXG00_02465 [Candidatus Woesearchaeota archaeon]